MTIEDREGLPEGWTAATIPDLTTGDGFFSDGDWVESKDQNPAGNIRLLQLADVGDGVFVDKSHRFIDEDAFKRMKCKEIRSGDILLARMPDPLGRACTVGELTQRSITVVDVSIIRPSKILASPKWMMHTLNASEIRNEIEVLSSGTTRKRISRGNLATIPLPLPPLAEQIRIADKLDVLLSRVNVGRERLERVPKLVKRFRQSVLSAAVSGELTREWRENNPGTVSPLQDIYKAITKMSSKNSELRSIESFYAKNTLDDSADLPEGWISLKIGHIGIVSNGATPSRAEADFWGNTYPWVSSGEVSGDIISTTKERVSQIGFEKTSIRILPKGTVLIAMIGEGKTRGQTAILDIEACINQNIAAIVFDKSTLKSLYLHYWFQTNYQVFRVVGNGTGPQALNCQRVREFPISLPPINEQAEIIRRVEALFAIADRLEARAQAALARYSRLSPALLAKAFRGELVPQDPADEPASVLLERIRAQREAAGPVKKVAGRGRKPEVTTPKAEAGAQSGEAQSEPKRGRGRPRKVQEEAEQMGRSIPVAASAEEAIRLLQERAQAERAGKQPVQAGLFGGE